MTVLVLLAACDYQPRPGSTSSPRTSPATTTAARPAGACPVTLAVDGMT